MKKVISTLTSFLCLSLCIGQNYPYPVLDKGEPIDALYGISKTMMYQTEIRSKAKQTELIKKVKGFLALSGLLDSTKVKLNKITDKQSSFILPLQFSSGYVAGKGKTMLSKRLRHPVDIFFDAKFDFSDTIITISFSNFSEKAFYEIQHFTEGNYPPWLGLNYAVGDPKAAKLDKLKDDVMQGATLFGKIMTVYDAGGTSGTIKLSGKGVSVETDNAIKNKFEDLKKSIEEQYSIINNAVANNLGQWLPDVDVLSFMANNKQPRFVKFTETAKARVAEGFLLIIDNNRWDTYFEPVFNSALLNIANLISGEIKEIKKDNTTKYTFANGNLQSVKSTK